ncbi:hypothetical protein PRZ48_013594 [Zasmidium cellare]|uniref:Uncharacterized protein n=1 Tax=Zasmidium cellare TaxID=395010 RepID=A0ABR0E1W3_ZASCE|nr:hypothetical protein PRZ48_013594 [Zasmidium cellare]
MDVSDLKGKTAVITGAARGLGLSFASALAQAKCNIAVLDIVDAAPEDLLRLGAQHEIRVEYYACDISSKSHAVSTITRVEQDFGRIDINVSAAGVVSDEPFVSTTEQNLERTMAINFNGSFFVAQACAASMIKRIESSQSKLPIDPVTNGGSIIFITSIATHIPSAAQNICAYIASKAAVKGLVKPLAVEMAPYGVRVNSISPGYMMTDMMRGLQERQPDLVRQFQKETLLGGGERIGDPENLLGPLVMICSSKAGGWVTGQDLLVDGGAGSWKHPVASEG